MAGQRRSLFEDVDRILAPAEGMLCSNASGENSKKCDVNLKPSVSEPRTKAFNIPSLVVKLEKLAVCKTEKTISATGSKSTDKNDKQIDISSTNVHQKRSNQHIKKTASDIKNSTLHNFESDSEGSPLSPLSDLEDDDGELVEILKNKKQSTKDYTQQKMPKRAACRYEDDSFVQPKYKFDLSLILSEREAQMKTNLKLEAMEQELKADRTRDEANTSSSAVLAANNLDIRQFVQPQTQFKEAPPGIHVIDLKRVFTLYRLPSPPKICPSTGHTSVLSGQLLDSIFSQLEPSQILDFLQERTLEQFPREISTRSWLMTYIFHLLGSHPDCHIVDACHRVLWSIQSYYSKTGSFDAEESWRPTVEDVVAVFVNCGAKLENILPSDTLFSHMDVPFLKEKCGTSAITSVPENVQPAQLPIANLSYFLKTLASYIRCGLYSDEELLTILFAVCAVALDVNLINLLLDSDFKECIDAVLQGFTTNYWKREIKELVIRFLDLGSHHHNFVHLAKLMAYNERALQFQKLFCFLALHRLLEIDVPEQCSVVTPYDVFQLIRRQPLVSRTDYYCLQSIFMLIDLCIGKEPDAKFKDNLERLTVLLREMAGRIRDNVHCLDATRVKNFIVRIAIKWSFITQSMPSTQPTLFRYMSVEQDEPQQVVNLSDPQCNFPELVDSEITELASLQDQLEEVSLSADEDDWSKPGT